MSDFTIIIQGLYNDISVTNLENYKKFGDVIFSCWDTDIVPSQITDNYKVVRSTFPDFPVANPQNIFRQSTTVFNGLMAINTPYFIKVRSDEYYSDLSKMVEKIRKYPNKYICNNIWFEKIPVSWMHPGDHIIGGSSSLFRKTFADILDMCIRAGHTNNVFSSLQIGMNHQWRPFLSVEQVIFVKFMLQLASMQELEAQLLFANDYESLKRLFMTYCDFVPLEELGHYIWSFVNGVGTTPVREWHTTGDVIYNWPNPSIRTWEEVY
jgi:hypothetical protein